MITSTTRRTTTTTTSLTTTTTTTAPRTTTSTISASSGSTASPDEAIDEANEIINQANAAQVKATENKNTAIDAIDAVENIDTELGSTRRVRRQSPSRTISPVESCDDFESCL